MQVSRAAFVAFAAAALLLVLFKFGSPIVDTKANRARSELSLLRFAIDAYKRERGGLPNELSNLVDAGFVAGLPADPWGSAYMFRRTASKQGYVVYSTGSDKLDQQGAGDDITSGL